MEKNIFIGGKFLDSQLLFTLPMVDGYCEKKKIKTIIYEKDLPFKIINNKNLSKLLKKISNCIFAKAHAVLVQKSFVKSSRTFYSKFIIGNKIFQKKLLTKKNWFDLQIFHSLWDTSLVSIINKRTKVNFFDIFISSLRITFKLYEQRILKKNNIIAAFLGHSVYESRSILACLRQYCLHVYCHSNYSFYLQEKFKDLHWSFIKKQIFFKLIKNISSKKINKYFKLRERGKGNYEDSRYAALISSKFDKNFTYPENVIMLHIFHDSAFSLIDKNRIFIDYTSKSDKW